MTLDVIICTYMPDGIGRVAKMDLPKHPGVNYIVSWQGHQDAPVPEVLQREDVKIYRMEGAGLSRNRNNGLAQSQSDIIYLADDDIILMPEIFATILGRFEEYPDTQIATFEIKDSGGSTYPDRVTDLGFYLPKNYSVRSIEIAFRREILGNLKFNEQFGLKSGVFECGEEELFHLSARKRGYKCRFFPDIIADHPHESTGWRRINDRRVLYGMGAIICKSYPRTALLRMFLKAYRLNKSGTFPGILKGLVYLIKGAIMAGKISV